MPQPLIHSLALPKEGPCSMVSSANPILLSLLQVPDFSETTVDESVPVYVVMELGLESNLEDNDYKSFISRIAISIEVVAVEGQDKTDQTSRPNDGIHILHVAVLDEQNSTRTEVDFHDKRLSIWKVVVPLGRHENSL